MPELRLDDKAVAIHQALDRARVAHAIGGAIALGFYAEPRATFDIDVNVFVPAEMAATVLDSLSPLGVDVEGALQAIERVDQARVYWESTPVDLFFADLAFHDAMSRAVRRVNYGSDVIPILAPEHLMVCKALFNRGKDWLDIQQMLVTVSDLRVNEVAHWMDAIAGEDDSRTQRLRALMTEMLGRS